MRNKLFAVGLMVCGFVLLMSFSAHAFTSVVAYGDSLSDDGHTGLFCSFPDGVSRFTNKEVWIELVADATGSQLYDVAFAGATTGHDNPEAGSDRYGLQWQVGAYQSLFSFNLDMRDTLFSVWAGANDFFQGRDFDQAAQNVGTAIQTMADNGAQHILVPNLPDLGSTPAFYDDVNPNVPETVATGWTQGFNMSLEQELAQLRQNNHELNLYTVDIYRLFFEELLEYDENGNIINHAELFWDPVHPTIVGHSKIAEGALRSLNAVPVPAPIILLGTGLIAMFAFRRNTAVRK